MNGHDGLRSVGVATDAGAAARAELWPRDDNLLLSALPDADRARVDDALERVALPLGMTIYEADEPIAWIYFPCRGAISMVSAMEEGTVEVGTVGREGMAGLPVLFHAVSMPTRAFVQVQGEGYRIRTAALRRLLDELPSLRRVLYRYAQSLFDQVAQSVACNRLHTLEERCARWILMSQDHVQGDVLTLKQQFLAEMLGVHRPAVTLAAGALQRAGLIRYSRGKVTVLDRAGLERASCACYAITRRSMQRLRDDLGAVSLCTPPDIVSEVTP